MKENIFGVEPGQYKSNTGFIDYERMLDDGIISQSTYWRLITPKLKLRYILLSITYRCQKGDVYILTLLNSYDLIPVTIPEINTE